MIRRQLAGLTGGKALQTYFSPASRALRKQDAQICTEYDISPREITALSEAIGPFNPDLQNTLVIPLLLAASTLSDPQATIALVSRALQAPRPQQAEMLTRPGMELTLRHLSALSRAGNPASMVLLGRILEKEGKGPQALKLFQEATETEWDKDLGFESGVASAWLSIGQLKLKLNDRAGGEAALKKGADLNDPNAAFYYTLTLPPEHKDYHTYTMKAAVSGIVKAQHNLGMFYLQQASAKNNSVFRRMAMEWFILAATREFAPSQLSLALMLKDEGKGSEGLVWVDKAERNQAFAAEAARVKARWKGGRVHIGDSGKITIT
ncbi:hypothetical protein FGG08_000977 [Glutinoglossum americanum]|uniref:Uncharacterized protein n=1 Tax=Glutinoglossum americanum TaxID=1670608 RepID=A0A9P8IFK9_9PEZI|nr:hypothetical protein FGG08_000977 [Glutinoglossum americanum]